MLSRQAYQPLCDFIAAGEAFTIIAHISPDGDTLGSTLALRHILQALGKGAQVVCADTVPAHYMFLPGAADIRQPQTGAAPGRIIAVDCADTGRMGAAAKLLEGAIAVANIDHHGTNSGYGHCNLVESSAAAAGELIYGLAKALDAPISPGAASCLYMALMTDTGNFAYSNTTGETLRTAAALLELGADGYELNLRIFRRTTLAKLQLLNMAIQGLRLYEDGRIGITAISQAQLAACQATAADTDGIVEQVRDIETVEIAIFFKEQSPNVWKASLRAKRHVDVARLCAQKGGGGHARAAGYTAEGSLAALWEEALKLAKEAL